MVSESFSVSIDGRDWVVVEAAAPGNLAGCTVQVPLRLFGAGIGPGRWGQAEVIYGMVASGTFQPLSATVEATVTRSKWDDDQHALVGQELWRQLGIRERTGFFIALSNGAPKVRAVKTHRAVLAFTSAMLVSAAAVNEVMFDKNKWVTVPLLVAAVVVAITSLRLELRARDTKA